MLVSGIVNVVRKSPYNFKREGFGLCLSQKIVFSFSTLKIQFFPQNIFHINIWGESGFRVLFCHQLEHNIVFHQQGDQNFCLGKLITLPLFMLKKNISCFSVSLFVLHGNINTVWWCRI